MTRTMPLIAVSVALAATLGCSEQSFTPKAEDDNASGQLIEVSPLLLEYDVLSDGEEQTRSFTVTNIGTAELSVSDIEITGSESFLLLSPDTEFALPPGASSEFDVLFTPLEADENYGSATVYSDDPENEQVVVQLVGTGAVPELMIDPDPYDFGVDYVGCGYGNEFILSNVGTDPLVIDAVDYSATNGMLSMQALDVGLPVTLAPKESTSVWVDFMPDDEAPTSAMLEVTSNDPRGVVSSEHTAEGVYAGYGSETFTVPEDPPVDIIFAIDRSCSMDDDAASLSANLSTFISAIESVTTGWQIGVVTADNGCFNTWIDASTPNYESLFTSAALSNNWGAWTEGLLTVSRNAIDASFGGCNNGFIRDGAMTHAIMISDEPEQSAGSWSSYVTEMQGIVADPSLLKLSAIAGDYPSGCGSADAGIGYWEAVNATGGEFLSICSNWAKNVDVLAQASLDGLSDFELEGRPDPSTLTVTVNGKEWVTGWHYDEATNSIVFDDEVPQGASVTVDYGELVDCD